MICDNCGRLVDNKTLVCNFCGTDYNSHEVKPKCEHYYDRYQITPIDIRDMSVTIFLTCGKCKEVTKLRCSERMIRSMI